MLRNDIECPICGSETDGSLCFDCLEYCSNDEEKKGE